MNYSRKSYKGITPLCSLLHIFLKGGECVCRTSENCKSLVLQDKCNIKIFLSTECYRLMLYVWQSGLVPLQFWERTPGSHRHEKYLNCEGFLEKSLKIKSALKSTGKSLKSLEKSLNLLLSIGLSNVDRDLNQYKIAVPLFGAAQKKRHTNFILIFQYYCLHYFSLAFLK